MTNLEKAPDEEARKRMEEAMARHDKPWWDSDDLLVLAKGQLSERILLIDFALYHKAVESALERPVWTHEFIDRKGLLAELEGKIPKATFDDVFNKIPKGKPTIVVFCEESSP